MEKIVQTARYGKYGRLIDKPQPFGAAGWLVSGPLATHSSRAGIQPYPPDVPIGRYGDLPIPVPSHGNLQQGRS